MRDRVFAKAGKVVRDLEPGQLRAYALVEGWTYAIGLIQRADGDRQQVSLTHVEADAAAARSANHAPSDSFLRLGDELPAQQLERCSWNMNEGKHRRAGVLPASVAVAVASIEHLSDLEAYRVATTPASQESTHGDLPHNFFD